MYSLLKGLRLIEGSAFVAAPLGGMSLAQLGADVIRFDQIGGGIDFQRWPVTDNGSSIYWSSLNKGKRSIAINLRAAEGRELVKSLITDTEPNAGLFLTNFPSDGWLAYDALKQDRSDLIMINIQGNADGSSAVDYTVNSATGLPHITGTGSKEEPVNHVLPAWDVTTGLYAAMTAVSALLHRKNTGEGSFAKIALSDVALATMSNLGFLGEAEINRNERTAIGNNLYGAFGRDFRSADGRRFMLVAISLRQWRALVTATSIAKSVKAIENECELDLDNEGERYQATEGIASLIEAWAATRNMSEICECFEREGVCWGPYQSIKELLEKDPRCSEENEIFQRVKDANIGQALIADTPVRFQNRQREEVLSAPRIGEHTDEILSDVLGMSDAQIGKLHQRGVIAGPNN